MANVPSHKSQDNLLLRTKLYIPPLRSELVPRPRLVRRLNEGTRCKLTLVSAPAGFGKTTLLSEWIAGLETKAGKVAWLSLDGEDNDPIRFLTYLIMALRTLPSLLKAEFGETAMALLRAPQPPMQAVLTTLTNQVDAISQHDDAGGPFILVLDDYHFIESQQVDDALTFLLDYLLPPPRGMQLVIADLISHDRQDNSGLQSFIRRFIAVLEFDADRKGRPISQSELTWYSACLGQAVTDCIQYFIGHGHPYPAADHRYLAATAAHITHMLRDMVQDIPDGFINIPREYLEAHGIRPQDTDSALFRAWVQGHVELARDYFRAGKGYLDDLDVLRCKIAGYWYCARFEGVLETIERDEYVLRPVYHERRKLSTWLRMAWLAVTLTLRHVARRGLATLSWGGSARHGRVQKNP